MERKIIMLILILMVLLGIIVLFLYSACILSSRISRKEEKHYEKNK